MLEAYRMIRKPGEHTGAYCGKCQKGTEGKGNSGEGAGSVKKHLVTTVGRKLDIRS